MAQYNRKYGQTEYPTYCCKKCGSSIGYLCRQSVTLLQQHLLQNRECEQYYKVINLLPRSYSIAELHAEIERTLQAQRNLVEGVHG